MQIAFFDPIMVEPPKDKIYSRLGYAKGLTDITEKQRKEVDKDIEYALTLIKLKGLARRISIKEIKASQVILSEETIFKSHSLAGFLTGYPECLILGATSGQKIVKTIQESSNNKNFTQAVVLDAVASEMTDAALNWIVDYFNNQLRRENKRVSSRRFSAGYGDFSLVNQKIIVDILDMKRIKVAINNNFMLIPEKSVTAVAGIK
ncbi:MAG: hypothetical protein KBB01_02485 [Candidatus Omnitrophica bacterium]|jgi:hypothetical protein|nr:hypothetical protein [Candidatus Omnitrophota bacterium]